MEKSSAGGMPPIAAAAIVVVDSSPVRNLLVVKPEGAARLNDIPREITEV